MAHDAEPTFSVVAMSYPSNGPSAQAYEQMMPVFARLNGTGDSLSRFTLDGAPIIAVVAWSPTEDHVATIASLPWGAGHPVVLPPAVTQQLARRSLEAAPKHPDSIRRIHRDPTGRVLRDESWSECGSESPDEDDAA